MFLFCSHGVKRTNTPVPDNFHGWKGGTGAAFETRMRRPKV